MSKVHTTRFIEDASFKDAVMAIGGALGMFAIARFFKNGDSLRDRVRMLESGQKVLETKLDTLQTSRDEDSKTLKKMDDYLHYKLHNVCNVLNSQMVGDALKVMDLEKKVETLLKEKK